MSGYELAEALRKEADDARSEARAALMRDAANEIERLIESVRRYQDEARASMGLD